MIDLRNFWIERLPPEMARRIFASCSQVPVMPLFAAVEAGVPIYLAGRGEPIVKPRSVKNARWIVVVQDDDETSLGPTSFDPESLAWLCHEATSFFVYAGGAEARYYAMVACAAVLGGRVLLVECRRETAAAWSYKISELAPRLAAFHVVDGVVTPSEPEGRA